MARQLADVGFTGVMATPHFIEGGFTFEPQLLRAKVDELNRACRKERIPLTFYPGGEIMAAYNFMADSRVFLPTLNSSRYLLLEIPPIIYSGEPSPCFSCVSIAFQLRFNCVSIPGSSPLFRGNVVQPECAGVPLGAGSPGALLCFSPRSG